MKNIRKSSSGKNIGQNIKKIRASKKMTLKALAEETGLSIGYLSQLERGLTTVSKGTCAKLAAALGVSTDELSYNERLSGKKDICIIGGGNMGSAIATGIVTNGIAEAANVTVSDVSEAVLRPLKSKLKINTVTDNKEAATKANVLILAVKPAYLDGVLEEISGLVADDTLVVSIVAGRKISYLAEKLGEKQKIVRVMPNTPALVNAGMSALCPSKNVTARELKSITEIFSGLGKAVVLEERMFDAVTAVSGSGPAYVYMFIQALADAGVREGLPRDVALELAAQTVLGSAKLVIETAKHPEQLKDEVCSPGGTTIEAVAALEEAGFRNAIMQAVKACADKSRNM